MITTLQSRLIVFWRGCIGLFEKIPYSLIAFFARFSVAAVFWQSGQTKIDGFALNLISGDIEIGWPKMSEGTFELFQSEYALPVLSPEFAAYMAATAEHLFPLLLLIGLMTRFSALALLGMTVVIQIFVCPDAYATHGTWAASFLYLMIFGPGKCSLDNFFFGRKSMKAMTEG